MARTLYGGYFPASAIYETLSTMAAKTHSNTQRKLLGASIAAGSVVLLLWGLSRPKYAFGGPNKGELDRDPTKLLPAFAARLNTLFSRMRALGWDPILNEGYRTPARAAKLAQQGVGTKDSLHIYGAAADIISESALWSNPRFFEDLGREAEKLGLYWGGRFGDPNHVQAVSLELQDELRAAGSKTWNHANTFVANYYARAA